MMGKAKAAYELCQRKRCAVFVLREVNLPVALGEGCMPVVYESRAQTSRERWADKRFSHTFGMRP